MRICIVAPSLQMGGVERASSTFANYLAQSNEVYFLPVFPHKHFFELDNSIAIRQPEFNKKSLQTWRSIRWLRKEIKRIDPQVVFAFNNIYGALTIMALLGTRYKICISDRSSPLFKWPWKIEFFNRIVFYLRPPDGVMSQTSIAAFYTRKRLRGSFKQVVIPNALRPVKEYQIQKKLIILAVGRLGDPLKGFDRLIHAFAKVDKKEWTLAFAGGDDDGQHLKNLALNLGILDHVKFFGKIKDMDRVYAEAGIFVIPSRSEGFPNALCEAMAAGLPCISFNFTAGPSEIISHGVNGILVEDGNIDAMTEQIQRLIESESLRMHLGANAKQIRDRFDENKIGQEVLNFLKSVVSGNGSR
jgi:GalNAc-alpha-(1->4)-GalNAc-alpha-(1->3)-diNAcBac-PP-undecaprenol alpha-1,4-N-acetyl-D-galactosaminyltransferase